MSTGAWILCAAVDAVFLLGLLKARRLWRDESDAFDDQPVGQARSYPVKMAVGLAVVTLLLIAFALGDPKGGDVDPLQFALVVLAVLGMLAGGALTVTVRRWGRPSALVPPHLRERHGR
jgi:Na+/H+ antiporter NhaD/arsenite permease-like protein